MKFLAFEDLSQTSFIIIFKCVKVKVSMCEKHIQSIPARPSKKQRRFDKLTHLHTHGVRVRHKQHLWFYLFCLGENKKEEPNYL